MIADHIAQVRARIAEACARAGRDAHTVTLVAVCKTKPVALIREAAAAGLTDFGENRPEEAAPKIETLSHETSALRWHMIGHVQSRKVKLVVPHFHLIHSVDSLRLAEKFSRAAQESGRVLDVLLQMNVSGESSKEGIDAHAWDTDSQTRARVFEEARRIAALPALRLHGLMTIAPFTDDESIVRPVFASLRNLRDALAHELGAALPQLSMGMTDDYPIAIEEGATLVRIGRAIFGERDTAATETPSHT